MEAKRHVFQSAGELVEEAMQEFVAPEQPNICKPKNLSRAAHFPRSLVFHWTQAV